MGGGPVLFLPGHLDLWRFPVVENIFPKGKTMLLCKCGCGREIVGGHKTKIWFSAKCRLAFYKQEAAAGRLEPDGYRTCGNEDCGKKMPVYDLIPFTKKRAGCCVECSGIIANRKNGERKGAPKKTKASHDVRANYCHRPIEGRFAQLECARYNEASGEGCYREENGKPCCFVAPKSGPENIGRYRAVSGQASYRFGS